MDQERPGFSSQKNGKEPPPTLPKPILDNRTTTMRLRVNFSPQDLEDDQFLHESDINGVAFPKPPERKNSLLLESMMKAMQRNAPTGFDEGDEEDDIIPDSLPPWMNDGERRDSVEQTRIKLAMKGPTGAGKAKNQRDRRRLRNRRSTGVAIFDEIRNSVDLEDDEWNGKETKKNTALNEQPHHQLMQQAETPRSNHQTFQLPSTSTADVLRSNRSQMTGLVSSLPQSSNLMQTTNLLFDELDKELDALMKGLDGSSEKGSYTDSGVGSDYSTGAANQL